MSEDGPIYEKYTVLRNDRTDVPGGKHDGCDLFVLDLSCDPYAKPAALAYADACEKSHPQLAASIRVLLEKD